MNKRDTEADQRDVLVACHNVTKSYTNGNSSLVVLNDLSFTMQRGETVVVMGSSGCGKSTFLHIVGGLDSIDSGSVSVDGVTVQTLQRDELPRYRAAKIGFIFQLHYLLEDFSALENLVVAAMLREGNRRRARDKSADLLAQVGLADKMSNYPSQLSGGERQRVAIARSLVNDPELILADEPTGSLDEENSAIIEELLFSIVKIHGKSMILVTHDPGLAGRAGLPVVLKKGKFVE